YPRAQVEPGSPVSYPALVTDVRNFGFFVDVPDLAMGGLVPLSMLEDDFYVFDPARSRLVGRRTRRVVGLGDRPLVQIAKVDSFKKQVDFRLASSSGKTGLPVSAHGGRAGNQRFPGTGEGPRRRGGRGGSSVGTKTAERKPVKPSGSDFRDGPKGSGRGGRGGSSGPRPSPAGGPRSGRRTR
ncbi:MAG: S1 RNA-binding domain-containing protein, partial [Limisphaerales bacterium]